MGRFSPVIPHQRQVSVYQRFHDVAKKYVGIEAETGLSAAMLLCLLYIR